MNQDNNNDILNVDYEYDGSNDLTLPSTQQSANKIPETFFLPIPKSDTKGLGFNSILNH